MTSSTNGHASALRSPDAPAVSLHILAGGGEMGERTRSLDWSATPVGPYEDWPRSLKAAVSICLGSRHPMVVWWGRPTYTQFYNDAYISFLGPKHPASLGRSGRECWNEIWPVIGPMIEGVCETGEATWSEDLLLVLDRHLPREEAYFTFSYSAIREDDGTVGGIFCACNETTARVLGERRLKTLRDLNRVVAEAKTAEAACKVAARILDENRGDIPYALIYLLDEGTERACLAAVSGLEAGCAAAPEEIDLTKAGDFSAMWPLARALDAGTAQRVPDAASRFACLSGGLWPEPSQAALIVPIPGPDQSKPTGFLVSGLSPRRVFDEDYRDFLELAAGHLGTSIANARAHDAERRRAEALAEIDRAKTAFFSNVSHEFRTPLTLMLGPVVEAVAHPSVPEAVRTQLEIAHRNAQRLLKLVNSLLDFSRIEAGRIEASYEPTDLATLTRDLAGNFRSAMERAGLAFTVECADFGAPVYVDREMWEKIVLNLLSNAFKFTLQGGVIVRLQREGCDAVLEVVDTGVGIPADELPHLFERFHRVEGTAGRTQEGTGIGLALVSELVKLHGGSAHVSSELGLGTRLRVRVPLGTEHLPRERVHAPRSLTSTSGGAQAFVQEALRWIPAGRDDLLASLAGVVESPKAADLTFARVVGARIVLADDNADMRDYVCGLLLPTYRVEAVADGAQALDAARRERPDLILSDIMMPQLDGLALLRALRSDPALRDIPVIFLSARAGEEERVAGLDIGADDYLIKPFSARELLARVGARLELTRMRREHEERLRLALSSIQDQFYMLDREWRYTLINPRVAEVTGRSAEELLGRSIFEHFPDLVGMRFEAELAAAVEEQEPRRFELEYRPWSGWFENVIYPAAEGVAVLAIDITARKQAEERLRASEAALRNANRHKDEFLALLGHELRSPLAPISMASEVLSRTRTHDVLSWSAIETIKRQTAQLTRLVDDLLDIGRVTQGRVELKFEPVELAKVIAQAVETVEPDVRRKQHRFTSGNSEALYVSGDRTRLVQCVVNLLTNAVKYTDPGGEIQLRARAEDSSAIIEVTDTGAGIPPELLPRIFDLYVQSDRTLDRAQGGLGIGLSIVKRLIELHEGEVTAHSGGLGRGSTFQIRLPRIAQPAVGIGREAYTAMPRRVLVVDDNADAANTLALLLSLAGHETLVAFSGAEALERVVAFRPDVALLDIGIPDINGYELARRFRAGRELQSVRLVALTGYGQLEDRQRALAAGFDDHLVKPVSLSALQSALAGVSRPAADRGE